jgi:hypothetical protein
VVAVAVVPLVFHPGIYDNFTLPKQAVLLVAAGLVVAGLLLSGPILPASRLLRLALLGWAAWLTLALVLGEDRRGSLLGYYQYRQGYLTQLACVALFLGAFALARRGRSPWLLWAGVPGLAGAAAYTFIQSIGHDPVGWWVNTAERAFGTIGNANELAGYGVLSLAFCGAAAGRRPRLAMAVVLAVAALAGFTIMESKSRSGLAAIVAVAALYPLAGLGLGMGRRAVRTNVLPLLGGTLPRLRPRLVHGPRRNHGAARDLGDVRRERGHADVALARGPAHDRSLARRRPRP